MRFHKNYEAEKFHLNSIDLGAGKFYYNNIDFDLCNHYWNWHGELSVY